MTASAIGTVYLVGEVVGALAFGRLSDSRAAIRLAAQEARYRDTTLIAVLAYPAERGWSPAVRPGAQQLTPRRRPGRRRGPAPRGRQ
jgi:hypothetical protein